MSPPAPKRLEANVTCVVSLDLGGRFTDSLRVVEVLKRTPSFDQAFAGTRFDNRLQLSYRYGTEPEIVALRTKVGLRLASWTGEANQLVTLHPAGVATFELELEIPPDRIKDCTKIEDDLDHAMRIRYVPYLAAAFKREVNPPTGPVDDLGVDFITPTEELRKLLSGELVNRPTVYPAIDIRTTVSVLVDDLDAIGIELIDEFVEARRSRAQLSTSSPSQAQLGGLTLDIQRSAVAARRWRCLLYASCDADAALIVTDEGAARRIGHDCVAMSQKMWYLARTWAGVLDEVGTLKVEGDLLRQEEIQAMERHVLDLSTLEMEIAYSMTTVEAAGVMLRDTWHIELVEESMRRFGVEGQQRLIERRLHAVARNHDTVSEILDRVHQKSARGQADRLQRLFAGAVAASLTALIPATIQVDQSAVHVATESAPQ